MAASSRSPGDKSASARSEASWDTELSSSNSHLSATAEVPATVSRLVKRTVSVDRREFDRLQAWDRESRIHCTHRDCCWWCPPPPLRPSSPFYAWWALVMLVLDLSYTAVLCPVLLAFAPREIAFTWAFVVDFVAGFLFTIDIAVNFHVGYMVQHGMRQCVVMQRRVIAKLYMLRGTFAVDALSSLAWFAQFALLLMALSNVDPSASIELANVLRIARILRILRVLRLVKRLYCSHMGASERFLGLKPHTLHVIQLLYVAAIVFNFCGCMWFFVARESDYNGSWVTHYPIFVADYSADGASVLTAAEVEAIPSAVKWLASVYWACTTMLTVGYGDIIPWNTAETAVCMAVQLLGVCFTGALLGSVASVIQRASKAARRGAALEDKLAGIERYLREQRVPREVRRRIRRYYAEVWVQQEERLDAAAFYAELPHVLRTDMAWSIVSSTLGELHCFQAIQDNPAALRAIASRLEPMQLPPGFTLCEEGEEAASCWILQEGLVCLGSRRELDGYEVEESVEGPALLGEAALLGPSLGYPCHLGTLRTLTRCSLWRLGSADLVAALRAWPQALEAVRTVLLHGTPLAPDDGSGTSSTPGMKSVLPTCGSMDGDKLQIYVDARSRASTQNSDASLPAPPVRGGLLHSADAADQAAASGARTSAADEQVARTITL